MTATGLNTSKFIKERLGCAVLREQSRVAEVRDILKERDHRLTPQREAILKILLDHKDTHLTAEDIYQVSRDKNPEIGLATVYRTLDLFASLGILSRLDFGQGGRKYELSGEHEEHYHHHLLCLGCSDIIEFNEDLLEELETRIAADTNFRIVDHSLRFFGFCRACRDEHES